MKITITATDRTLDTLTVEELTEIFENNKRFQNIVFEYLCEDAELYVSDVLRYFQDAHTDYSLDSCGGYFKVRPTYYPEFLKAFITVCNSFCYPFCEELKPLAERLYTRAEFYIEAYNGYEEISPEKFEMLESWIESGIEKLTAAIVKFAEEEFSAVYDDDYNLDYFINSYIEFNGKDYIITETGEIYSAYLQQIN